MCIINTYDQLKAGVNAGIIKKEQAIAINANHWAA